MPHSKESEFLFFCPILWFFFLFPTQIHILFTYPIPMCRVVTSYLLLFLATCMLALLNTIWLALPKPFTIFGCIMGICLWFCITMLALHDERRGGESQSTRVEDIESDNIQNFLPTFQNTRIRDIEFGDTVLSFAPRAHIARLAIRTLPLLYAFLAMKPMDHDMIWLSYLYRRINSTIWSVCPWISFVPL